MSFRIIKALTVALAILMNLYAIQAFAEAKKILHIASYHDAYSWTHRIDIGIKKGLKRSFNNTPYEYKVFYMDTKRKNKPEQILSAAEEAEKIIKRWNPDIIITSDDNATKYVTSPLKDSGRKFVFTGVNNEPSIYNLPNKNVTGIIERFHAKDGIYLLKMLKPNCSKVVMLSDDSITGKLISEQLKFTIKEENFDLLGIHATGSFKEWKSLVKKYQGKADAFYVIVYFTMKDNDGKPVPGPEVLKWTRINSKIPEIGFWPFVTDHGGLASIGVDGVEQGYAASKIAVKILNGTSPADITTKVTSKSTLYINSKRARELNIIIPCELMESAFLIEK